MPRQLVNLGLDRLDLRGELAREDPEATDVDLHPQRFHSRQDRNQGALDRGVQVPEVFFPDPGGQDLLNPPGGVGVLAGVLGDPGNLDPIHRELALALADQCRDRDHRVAEQALRELVEAVVPLARLQEVAQDHRVGDGSGDLDPVFLEDEHVVLEVLADLLGRGVGQARAQGVQGPFSLQEPCSPSVPGSGGNKPPPAPTRTRGRPGAR